MRIILVFLLLYSVAFAGTVQKSFTIENDSSGSDIEMAQMDTVNHNATWGKVPDTDVSFWKVGPITPVSREARTLIRFNYAIDSLHELMNSDTGYATIDSGRIGIVPDLPGGADDAYKVNIAMLRPGQGTSSRHFWRGNGLTIGTDSGGVTWDSCTARNMSGVDVSKLPWSSPGAKGVGDTLGGTLYITPLILGDTSSAGVRLYLTLPGWSIEAMFDSSTSAKDTTPARYPGHVIFVSDTVDADNNGCGRTYCSGQWGDGYCNWSGCEPSLTIWVTFTQNTGPTRYVGYVPKIGGKSGGTMKIGR